MLRRYSLDPYATPETAIEIGKIKIALASFSLFSDIEVSAGFFYYKKLTDVLSRLQAER